MIKVLIIGLGSIGYRHFESLYNLSGKLYIDCYDISQKSILRVQNHLEVQKKNHTVRIIKSLNEAESKYDFLIHATGSDVRLNILKKVFKKSKIKYAILEKVLGQSLDSLEKYKKIEKYFKRCWVNTPMHEWDLYIKLKKKINIKNVKKIEFNNFDGLACNAIHFIDFVSTWKKQLPVKFDTSNLKNWYKSKRKGFFDVYGELKIIYPDNTYLILKSFKKNKNYHCNIYENSIKWTLIENKKMFYSSNGFKRNGNVEYQSELTSKIIKKIIKNQDCDLPQLNWSIKCHYLLIKSLLKYWNSFYNTASKNLPIT